MHHSSEKPARRSACGPGPSRAMTSGLAIDTCTPVRPSGRWGTCLHRQERTRAPKDLTPRFHRGSRRRYRIGNVR